MNHDTKIKLYEAGRYIFDPAHLPHQAATKWNRDDWIAFIDKHGKWSQP